jgi:hypothetical protein
LHSVFLKLGDDTAGGWLTATAESQAEQQQQQQQRRATIANYVKNTG